MLDYRLKVVTTLYISVHQTIPKGLLNSLKHFRKNVHQRRRAFYKRRGSCEKNEI